MILQGNTALGAVSAKCACTGAKKQSDAAGFEANSTQPHKGEYMTLQCNAALGAAWGNCARTRERKQSDATGRVLLATFFLQFLLLSTSAQAELFQKVQSPLHQFGFATAGHVQSEQDYLQFYNVTSQVLGTGAIVRTGLGWDPTKQNVPGFAIWSDEVLEPALERDIVVLPGIRTLNLDTGRYRMPTNAQWTYGLRQIVRMYGPNGVYQKGGSYIFNGITVTVAPHPSFTGLTDYELWNEPNTSGNLSGAMTPSRIAVLLKIGSEAMRDEASKLGFEINIIGPAIGGIDLAYLTQLWNADNNLFNYIDTLSIHFYTRFTPPKCDAFGTKKVRCVKSFAEIRKFMNSHGGTHVHLGTTEGGTAGDQGTCLGPQVLTEQQQATISTANLLWLRGRPWFKFDFWITTNPLDGTAAYSYACDSGTFDIPYWESKLGALRPDLTMKPWGVRFRDLVNMWRP